MLLIEPFVLPLEEKALVHRVIQKEHLFLLDWAKSLDAGDVSLDIRQIFQPLQPFLLGILEILINLVSLLTNFESHPLLWALAAVYLLVILLPALVAVILVVVHSVSLLRIEVR